MIIINADDWGGWESATDAALACFKAGRITSVSAMVFMADSERAASLGKEIGLDIGLHINFNQSFTGKNCPSHVVAAHESIRRFLRRSKYAQLIYNPWLRNEFRLVYQAQFDEFCRIYGRQPSHFDGHQHMHLCANALFGGVIPAGSCVRRSFSFWAGEKSSWNRAYRRWVDRRLEQRFVVTDYFFALSQCHDGARLERITELAKSATVELMTHPEKSNEQASLLGDSFQDRLGGVQTGTYSNLPAARDAENQDSKSNFKPTLIGCHASKRPDHD
jgi:predicted glycoside hydrolase/deacetylase ChbG (UPF0249 family)